MLLWNCFLRFFVYSPIEYEYFLNRSICPIDGILMSNNTAGQSEPGSNINEGLLHTLRISRTELCGVLFGILPLWREYSSLTRCLVYPKYLFWAKVTVLISWWILLLKFLFLTKKTTNSYAYYHLSTNNPIKYKNKKLWGTFAGDYSREVGSIRYLVKWTPPGVHRKYPLDYIYANLSQ